MLCLEFFKYAARRALKQPIPGFEDVADRVIELAPSEHGSRPPAVYLNDQLERVKSVQDETVLDFELARIHGGEIHHGATQAYILKDAIVHDGYVYSNKCRIVVNHDREKPFYPTPTHVIDQASLASSYVGNRYFGHWICDDHTRALAGQKFATPIFTGSPPSDHKTAYGKLLTTERIETNSALVKELAVIPDPGQNAFKRARINAVYDMIRKGGDGLKKGHGVYFHRGHTGVARILLNEEEIEQKLAERGFTILRVMEMSVDDIIAQSKDASVIIGVEGSQLMHGLFTMQKGGTLLCIQPPDRFNNVYKDLTDSMDMRYSFVMAEGVTTGFTLEWDILARTLDLIGKETGVAL